MARITIRNLDDGTKRRLRVRAAQRGHSLAAEARDILQQVMREESAPRDLAAAIRARVAPFGGFDLTLPAREPLGRPADFAEVRDREEDRV